MATKKRLSPIYELEKFANAFSGKVTKFQGDGLFRFGVLAKQFTGPNPEVENIPRYEYNRVKLVFSG